MALSAGLIRRLRSDSSDEPLSKRLKLAENVFCSQDFPMVRKDDHIFTWLCDELSNKNTTEVWRTIRRCLALEPKSFNRLSSETKNLLIENLITILNEYPHSEVLDEMLECCNYIFSNALSQSYSKEKKIILLMQALFAFTSKVLNSEKFETDNKFIKSDLAIESAEHAITMFVDKICRQNFSEKKNYVLIFIEELFFPLASLAETVKINKISSKIISETQKCIKRLLIGSIKNIKLFSEKKNDKSEETDTIFNALKLTAHEKKHESVIAAFTCLFQCAINTFQQNSGLIDITLRKLVECTEQKELSKQILISLLENSTEVSYNFDNEIEGVSLKTYLKNKIEEILSKIKRLKSSDYELLSAIAKLNPLIVEDITQSILQRILFEGRTTKKEEIVYENLIQELWKASVRLRRQHKFLSKYLQTLTNYQEKEVEDSEFRNTFDLPNSFVDEFNEDLKNKTTRAQILAMFYTLNFHLKSDCISIFKTSGSTTKLCLLTKIVSKFFVMLFEHSNFLDSSLPHDWQVKFYQTVTDLKDMLVLFTETLCEATDKHEAVIFIAFSNVLRIWCETYDLLRYYMPNIVSDELEFPVNESQLKELKCIIKKYKDKNCEESLCHLLLYKTVFYDRNNKESIKEKVITQLWSDILENHFEIISSFDEIQMLKLSLHLVKNASNTEDNLIKWTSVLKRNIPRITKAFITAIALQIMSSILEEVEFCSTKMIIEKTNFEKILKSIDNSDGIEKALRGAKKEIAKQDFKPLNVVHFDKVERNLMFLSNLPVSFLDVNIRKFLFMFLYTFEQETKQTINLKEISTNLYLDFLRQNDIDVLNYISNPSIFVNYFKDNTSVLIKIIKLSLNNLSALSFWNDFSTKEECNEKISFILLTCIDHSKSKISSTEHKSSLLNLSLNLSSKIVKELNQEMKESYEIAGLRVSLKIILSEKKKLKENFKKWLELTLRTFVENPETVVDPKLIQESLQLSLVVLSHRENFDINEEVIKKLCIILINNPDRKIFSHFLEVLKDKEFEFFSKSLSSKTKESLIGGDFQVLEKVTTIWESLSKAETKAIRSKWLCASVNNLLNDLFTSEIKEISCVHLLKIYQAFVTSKRMIRLTDRIVDSILVTSMMCLDKLNKDVKLIACEEALRLCIDFVRSKTDLLLDRLPQFTNLFRKIFEIILQEAKETDYSNEQTLRILAVDIEKFCTFFAKLKKDVARISPYLIADLIEISSQIGVLPSFLKVSFDSSICQLLSNCDKHGVSFLSRTLPASTQQVFKSIYVNYKKYHKFTGKI